MSVAVMSPTVPSRRRKKRSADSRFDKNTMVELYELLQGQREQVQVYSKALNSHVLFVNQAIEREQADSTMPVFTTRELAFVLSLSEEELQRYYYLKMRLV
ncbi:MAG TPA: hypothetical protein PLG66_16305 [Calditrichia bacterium]|nr:hypothetical protein [Calditrichia bacterium]